MPESLNPRPLVSVIIPTFNRVGFLAEAVPSVLAQSLRDFELIIVDDGSTDETQSVYGKIPEVRYLRQPHLGVSAARNLGIRHARGSLISFLDSDDLWTRHKLARQVAWMDSHPDVQLCHTNEIWIRHGRRVNQKRIHQKYGGWIYPHCLPRCIVSPSSVLLRRELFEITGVFDEALPICEDYDLWLRITSRYEAGFIDEPLIIKRGGHPDQLSQSEWGIDRYRVTALLKMLGQQGLRQDWREMTLAMLKRKCEILASGYRKRGNRLEAERYSNLAEAETP